MNPRFLACSSVNADKELLLVEGQSALHAVEQVRHRQSQAILALQGKIPNVLTRPESTIRKNVQCQELFQTLGCDSGAACDLVAIRYDTVVILSDPDVDGAHSRYLLLLLFQHYLAPLVQSGRLAVVKSPRYRFEPAISDTAVSNNIESCRYFWSDDEKQTFLNSQPAQNTGRMTMFKGLGSLAKDELSHWVVAKNTRREVILR